MPRLVSDCMQIAYTLKTPKNTTRAHKYTKDIGSLYEKMIRKLKKGYFLWDVLTVEPMKKIQSTEKRIQRVKA